MTLSCWLDADQLQRMLDITSQFARQFQFRFNVKQGKSDVVVSPQPDQEEKQTPFRLGDGLLHLSPEYKYLGVEMGLLGYRRSTGWDSYLKRVERKATMAMHHVAYSVSGRSPLHISTAVQLFQTLVRPVLEYANAMVAPLCTVQSRKLLERVQVQFGRRLLHLQQCIPGTYVRRELKLPSLEQRGVVAALLFFGKLCCMPKERLAGKLFRARCNMVDVGLAERSWCHAVHELLEQHHLLSAWKNRSVDPDTWWKTVKRRVRHAFEQEAVQLTSQRPRLHLFHRLGPCTAKEWLDRPLDHPGAQLRFRLRCGGAPLMEQVGARSGDTVCRMCKAGQVETAEHFACDCDMYDAERRECLRRIAGVIEGVQAPALRQAMAARDVGLFLGDAKLKELPPALRVEVDAVLCNYLKLAWGQRSVVWRGMCLAGNEWRLR
jgi:hypothetical protein